MILADGQQVTSTVNPCRDHEALSTAQYDQGMTIVFVTHDPETTDYCERVVWIRDGVIRAMIAIRLSPGFMRGQRSYVPDPVVVQHLRRLKKRLQRARCKLRTAVVTTPVEETKLGYRFCEAKFTK